MRDNLPDQILRMHQQLNRDDTWIWKKEKHVPKPWKVECFVPRVFRCYPNYAANVSVKPIYKLSTITFSDINE